MVRWAGVSENLVMSNSDSVAITQPEIAELLLETGHSHHQAYAESDGVDPEWALWYSGYLQSRLWDRAGSLPTRSLLVHLLLSAEHDHAATTEEVPWPQFYAGAILAALTGS
jgi:NAD(P)H-hydrate epimerase